MAKIQSNECMSIIYNNFCKSRKRIEMGKELLQKMIIPTLTFGSETWNKLTEKDEINGVQNSYLKKMFQERLPSVHLLVA